jgi:imidazole glycerol phosphate synthase subunit HisF
MAFKRIISTLFVKDGMVVKSYGYRYWRPAGKLRSALQNLDRWQTDEILVIDISRRARLDPVVLREITSARISTPLVFGGGIRREEDVHRLLDVGCDRIVLENLALHEPHRVHELANLVGSQALIGSLPIVTTQQGMHLWQEESSQDPPRDIHEVFSHYEALPFSEILLIDAAHEGFSGKGHATMESCIDTFPGSKGIIWFGGLDEPIATTLLRHHRTVAVAFGNVNFERELHVPLARKAILGREEKSLRKTRIR